MIQRRYMYICSRDAVNSLSHTNKLEGTPTGFKSETREHYIVQVYGIRPSKIANFKTGLCSSVCRCSFSEAHRSEYAQSNSFASFFDADMRVRQTMFRGRSRLEESCAHLVNLFFA